MARRPDADVARDRRVAKMLRSWGATYAAIGRHMGIAKQTAYEMVNDAARSGHNARRLTDQQLNPEKRERARRRLQARRDAAKAA